MKTKFNTTKKGFTIIEVLIVLAIAALILLIVFLAVPALQRNSRNTSRRSDVARMLGGMNEAISNNNGVVPGSLPAQVTDKLGFYAATDVNYTYNSSAPTAPAAMDTSKVYIANYLKCGTLPAAAAGSATFNISGMLTTTGATARSVVAYYAVETTGANVQPQCVES